MNYFKNRIDKVIIILYRQLQNRQLVTFGEKFKEIQKKLNLGNSININLIYIFNKNIKLQMNKILIN